MWLTKARYQGGVLVFRLDSLKNFSTMVAAQHIIVWSATSKDSGCLSTIIRLFRARSRPHCTSGSSSLEEYVCGWARIVRPEANPLCIDQRSFPTAGSCAQWSILFGNHTGAVRFVFWKLAGFQRRFASCPAETVEAGPCSRSNDLHSR